MRYKSGYDFSYKLSVGQVAWILHRLSGLALVFYLGLHIWVISHLNAGAESFNKVMNFLNSPLFKILEIGLWGVILYHVLNGIRLLLIDFAGGARYHKQLFWVAFLLVLILTILGAIPFLHHLHILGGK